ncbi:hypothetical protein GO755_13850 [Spirosoma sp. HMF4905]|uniref:Peptidase C14 caspase domain-containing protein n=1 Tax=Spirosoma arboris TaxID=2682092 RepID=A0A7K1SBG0_9BACT|nr:caspase family protein [Spirosoma arboris]MVM31120.1 hypothetical protein [Spirosoma arboris]
MRHTLAIGLILSLLVVSPLVKSQTLHFIVFADTDDPSIGGNDMKTYSSLTGNGGLAQTIAQYSGLTLNMAGFYGPKCQAVEVDKKLNELNPGKDDVVFFYFVGHGFNSRQNAYPSLIFGKATADIATIDASARNLRELYARIRAKKPRLTIVMGDACNKERTDPPVPITSGRPIDVMPPTNLNPERIKSLFRNWQGGFFMSSSQRNQFSHSDPKGGWMSISFQNALLDWCSINRKGLLTWKTLLDDVVKRTEAMAKQNRQTQSPQFEQELTPFSVAQPTQPALVSRSLTNTRPADAPCPSLDQFVNEVALAGIREDMPLLRDMNNSITTNNADAYAKSFSLFYRNQKPFYESLNRILFNRIGDLSPRCQQQFDTDTKWVKESTDEVNERYQVIQKYAQRPIQLVQQARSDLPSIIRRLEEILERLDK